MTFDDPQLVDNLCYQMKLADYPRGENRTRINRLFNGWPPFKPDDKRVVNVNFLEGTVTAQQARTQFATGISNQPRYAKATTDSGAVHKRAERSAIVTREWNRVMKNSLLYYECFRSKFASDVLHGIGPSVYRDGDFWCPRAVGVEDLGIPANILLTDIAANEVPFFYIYKSFTLPQLIKLVSAPKDRRDPAWNMPLVKQAIKWIDQQTVQLMGSNWPEVWSPEKRDERVKSDGGFYVGDQVPTLDCFDFYFWSDDKKTSGWRRRIILDSWGSPTMSGATASMSKRSGDIYTRKERDFLYDSGQRVFADKMSQIVNFQFADLSAVSPFRYHSVRSLGFLIYDVVDIQNRMRCSFNEAVFEALLNYFRVKSLDDVQHVLKVMLENRGFIDPSVEFVPASDRWQPNMPLIELGLQENKGLINQHSASYTTNPQSGGADKKEKTKFQAMAELQNMTALVSAALAQAYMYQKPEYAENFRRFCKRNSSDPEVVQFQARCMMQGVPERMLNPAAWEIEPEQVVGGGNKSLELNIAETLMGWRDKYDPEPQREILRFATQVVTDNAPLTKSLVPDEPEISNSIHDAQLRFGTLMAGGEVNVKSGVNHTEVVETLLKAMARVVQRIQQSGGMPTQDQLVGLQAVGQHIAQEIGVVAQDEQEQQRAKQYGDVLGKLMNAVKAFAQRFIEAKKKQNGQAQIDPKDIAKVKAMEMQAETKRKNARESHADKTAQKDIAFQQKLRHEQQSAALELQAEGLKARVRSIKE